MNPAGCVFNTSNNFKVLYSSSSEQYRPRVDDGIDIYIVKSGGRRLMCAVRRHTDQNENLHGLYRTTHPSLVVYADRTPGGQIK